MFVIVFREIVKLFRYGTRAAEINIRSVARRNGEGKTWSTASLDRYIRLTSRHVKSAPWSRISYKIAYVSYL